MLVVAGFIVVILWISSSYFVINCLFCMSTWISGYCLKGKKKQCGSHYCSNLDTYATMCMPDFGLHVLPPLSQWSQLILLMVLFPDWHELRVVAPIFRGTTFYALSWPPRGTFGLHFSIFLGTWNNITWLCSVEGHCVCLRNLVQCSSKGTELPIRISLIWSFLLPWTH